MLNPYELDFISVPKLYQIDPVNFDVYEINQEKAHRVCSVYEHDGILRSLLLKSDSFNHDFFDILYSSSEDDKIYFNLTNDQSEKFILGFKLTSNDESIVATGLQSLKDNKVEIIKWIRRKCEVYESSDFFEDDQVFPRYKTPEIECEVQHALFKASLKEIQINGLSLECEHDSKVEDKVMVNFTIGKITYQMRCNKIWESNDSQIQNKKVGFRIDFKEMDNYKKWKKLVMAFDLRRKKQKISNLAINKL